MSICKVMVLEDDEQARRLVKAVSSRAGHDVFAFRDGSVALAALKAQTFSLLLIDISMPRVDSLRVIDEMQKAGIRTPVVLITPEGSDGIDRGFDERVVKAIIRKPFDPDALGGLIDALCAHSEELVGKGESAGQ